MKRNTRMIEDIIEKINCLLKKNQLQPIQELAIRCTRDDLLKYSNDSVEYIQDNLWGLKRTDYWLSETCKTGPSWVHANIIVFDNEPPLLTLKIGNPVGNKKPSINVSLEQKKFSIKGSL